MRLGESITICLDQSWKSDSLPLEVIKVNLLTLHVGLSWPWLYRKFHARKIGFSLSLKA